MASATAARPRAPASRLAHTAWAVEGICWIVLVGAVLVGGDVHGQHDFVIDESTLGWPVRLGVFAAAWLVMVGAMMLPTTVPMLELFWAATAGRPRRTLGRATVLGTYVLVWMAFSFAALAGDAVLHWLVDTWQWLAARPGLVLGGTLLLAGLFQFSSLKSACLRACRSPLGMLWQHYRRGVGGAWALGVRHALSCLGCCWALMLVMFAAGVGSLLWMLLLTAVMVAEKTTSWGARLVAPAGIALIAGGLTIAGTSLFTSI
jgi:predicted metal-binding membrane protein